MQRSAQQRQDVAQQMKAASLGVASQMHAVQHAVGTRCGSADERFSLGMASHVNIPLVLLC